ncbi:B12-binding domain-containing protein [Chloroflexota bacterium]
MTVLDEINRGIIEGEGDIVIGLVKKALDDGTPAKGILDKGIIPGLRQVGALFEKGEYYLPELVVSGQAATKALEFLQPILERSGTASKGKFAIGTVQGDIHDIGKNIVIMMLKGNGWEVIDLGGDVPPEDFCSAVAEGDFQILGLSSLLTMSMPSTVRTIEALEAAGLRGKVKIIVGGAPTTKQWADAIGADGWADDAPNAVEVATTLIGKS